MTSVFDDPEKINDDPETMEAVRHFTEAIKNERIASGLSQAKITKGSGISQKTISEIETGGNFRMSNYIRISKALGLVPKIRFVKYRKSVRKV